MNDEGPICRTCGNDLATEGHDVCSDCLESGRTIEDDLILYASDLHARGRRATTAHRHVEGVLCRAIANELRDLLGMAPLDYDGKFPNPWARDDDSAPDPSDRGRP